MRTEARSVCPAFDTYFFPMFKAYLLADRKTGRATVLRLG
jgi:hypothetical protein